MTRGPFRNVEKSLPRQASTCFNTSRSAGGVKAVSTWSPAFSVSKIRIFRAADSSHLDGRVQELVLFFVIHRLALVEEARIDDLDLLFAKFSQLGEGIREVLNAISEVRTEAEESGVRRHIDSSRRGRKTA